MKRSVAKIAYILSIVVGMLLMMVCAIAKLDILVFLCAVVTVVANAAYCYFLRCPECGRWPRKGTIFTTYCPHCGEPLNDE